VLTTPEDQLHWNWQLQGQHWLLLVHQSQSQQQAVCH
jgi:hypothetical protein